MPFIPIPSSIPDQLLLVHGSKFAQTGMYATLQHRGLAMLEAASLEDVDGRRPALVLLDAEMLDRAPVASWRSVCRGALMVAEEHLDADADFLLPSGMPERLTVRTLEAASRQWVLRKEKDELSLALSAGKGQLMQMTNIGIALSAERDLSTLLRMILDKASLLASCDAASLFLVDNRDQDNPKLLFKLTKNDSVDIDFKEFSLPLNKQSLAGYVALTGEVLNIADAYELPDDVPYGFNKSFDESVGYRTRSMLVIPMPNHRGEVTGVLQFINRKDDYSLKLATPEICEQHTVPFDDGIAVMLRALASQAAVAIQNAFLMESINQLFDGFVQAAVMAIEQRDPTTSGHSFRVADLTAGLALALPRSNLPVFRGVDYRESQIREIRYASLLHDFGKVGVREHVLVKAKKLPESTFDIIRYRICLEKERVKNKALMDQLQLWERQSGGNLDEARQKLLARVEEESQRLDAFLAAIEEANEPSMLPDGAFDHLQEVHGYRFRDIDGTEKGLIDDDELLALSVRKGSLTEAERREIESHVTHTWNFLKLIPWTPELSRVPEIASKHHEKLDGTGYPNHAPSDDIPLQTRMMTISDIYDALTASDRPYKPAMPLERALNILEMEAKGGKLDQAAVQVFIEAKVYDQIKGKVYGRDLALNDGVAYAHHVCDVDLQG